MTGIAGYTLIYNSYGLFLAAHEPFVSQEQAIRRDADIVSSQEGVYLAPSRLLISDTDAGKEISRRIKDLKRLLQAYKSGLLKEHQEVLHTQ